MKKQADKMTMKDIKDRNAKLEAGMRTILAHAKQMSPTCYKTKVQAGVIAFALVGDAND